jgi:TPR repeat protein
MTTRSPEFNLVLDSEPFSLRKGLVVDNFNLFSDHVELLTPGKYVVKSKVTRAVFDEFIKFVQGEPIVITNSNYSSFLSLSEEFDFPRLQLAFDGFLSEESKSNSAIIHRLCVIEEEALRHDSEQLLAENEIKDIDSRLSSLEERIANLHKSFEAEQNYRRGQEFLNGEHGFEKSRSFGLSLLKAAADQNHSDSCYIYGQHLSDGLFCDCNVVEGAKYLQRSADLCNSYGEAAFGRCLQEGKGVKRDLVNGLKYLRRSANTGNSLGESWLGYAHQMGLGVEKDFDPPVRYYRRAISEGSALGHNNYGLALSTGSGVEKDLVEAAKYFKMAAD